MNVIEFLNNEFRNIVKEYNNSHKRCYCIPSSLQGKKEIVGFKIFALSYKPQYSSCSSRSEIIKPTISFLPCKLLGVQ